MKKRKGLYLGLVFLLFIITPLNVPAAVTSEEAASLKTTLTPLGGERVGNKDGSIPAWNGGISAPPAGSGYQGTGSRHPDPFADEKVLFSITAKNMSQYSDALSEGQQALLRAYPDTYRMDVYPSHRTHAVPEWVAHNTFKNATSAKLSDDGNSISGAYGGTPFPIPKNGAEVVWNHLLRFQGEAREYYFKSYLVGTDGSLAIGGGVANWEKYPYYLKNGSLETYKNPDYWYVFLLYDYPARRKGEMVLVRDPLNLSDSPRQAWQYLVGQRRVRRAPTIAYDSPITSLSAMMTWDEVYIFNGALDRYDWKLVGKKEMYIPYNCYAANMQMKPEELLPVNHVNPDHIRYERHRVWVVEGNLKEGQRHIYAKRVIYFDEDSWVGMQADMYDGRGSLWRTSMTPLINAYELPATVQLFSLQYDLQRGQYASNANQVESPQITRYAEPKDDDYFTPEQIRRFGTR